MISLWTVSDTGAPGGWGGPGPGDETGLGEQNTEPPAAVRAGTYWAAAAFEPRPMSR